MARGTCGEKSLKRAGNAAFETLALNIPGIVYRVHVREQNRMEFFNSMLEKMTGYKADELRKGEVCSIDPIIIAEERLHILEVVKDAVRDHKPFELEYRIAHKCGAIRYFFEKGQPIYDADGQCEFLDGVILDITDRKHSEMALRESEERFRSIFENSLDALFRWNLKTNRFDYLSPAFSTVTGFTPEELKAMGKDTLLEHVFPDDRHRVAQGIDHFPKLDKRPLECRFMAKNGEYRWLSVSLSAVNDKEGHPSHCVGSVRDNTGTKQIEEAVLESRTQLLQLAENIKEVFWIGSPDWMKILYVSPTYESVWGRSCRSLYEDPRSWLDAVIDEDRGRVRDEVDKKSAGDLSDSNFMEYRISRPDSSRRWISARAFPVRNDRGEIYRIAGIAEDITERKEIEERLRASRENLEIQVRERTAELERSNRELQNFAFVASHDLQEPLRKIRMFGDMIVSDSGNILSEQSLDYLGRMNRAGKRMRELLTSLLEYSRVSTRAMPFRRTDLNKSVEEALSNLDILIRETRGRIEVGHLPTLEGEPLQMVQLFQNLIGNALKFQRPGEVPFIKIHAHPVRSGKNTSAYRIFIEDNGIGFDEKDLGKIFILFQRLHARSAYEGTGMGLAICRKIVGRHGGEITAKSEFGKGATFMVTLPEKQKRGIEPYCQDRPGSDFCGFVETVGAGGRETQVTNKSCKS